MPKEIQSDQCSNFTSGIFQHAMHQLGIRHVMSSAYHPQSQGALEIYHQTLKTMITHIALKMRKKDWDERIHLLLFATRGVVQDSLAFSPFELVFGHTVRGLLRAVKEGWLQNAEQCNLLDYVSEFKYRLHKACDVAHGNLKMSQDKIKTWYDQKARERVFQEGDKVLVLLSIPDEPLTAKFCGPYTIDKKVCEVDYIVCTPDRRTTKIMCHVNMLNGYFERDGDSKPVMSQNIVTDDTQDESVNPDNDFVIMVVVNMVVVTSD